VTLKNGRPCFWPASAYKSLTDEEVLTLRHHRAAIKAVINAGASFAAPAVAIVVPEPEPPCPYCKRTPCFGPEHPAYAATHWGDPIEVKKRDDYATRVMHRMVGRS
jgi:hypothetical protein